MYIYMENNEAVNTATGMFWFIIVRIFR